MNSCRGGQTAGECPARAWRAGLAGVREDGLLVASRRMHRVVVVVVQRVNRAATACSTWNFHARSRVVQSTSHVSRSPVPLIRKTQGNSLRKSGPDVVLRLFSYLRLWRERHERSRKSSVFVTGGRIDQSRAALTATSTILPPSVLQKKLTLPPLPKQFA